MCGMWFLYVVCVHVCDSTSMCPTCCFYCPLLETMNPPLQVLQPSCYHNNYTVDLVNGFVHTL